MTHYRDKLQLSRRQFLRGLTLVAGGGLLAACAAPPEGDEIWARSDPSITSAQVPRPRSTGNRAAQDEGELARFLTLSALLTGVDQLDPVAGEIYLQSLQASQEFDISIGELLDRSQGDMGALPATLEELASRGLFEEEAARTLADKITEYWYTGVYDTPEGEQAVATYVDALAWQTLTFTKAMSVCGSYRFWTEPPELELD